LEFYRVNALVYSQWQDIRRIQSLGYGKRTFQNKKQCALPLKVQVKGRTFKEIKNGQFRRKYFNDIKDKKIYSEQKQDFEGRDKFLLKKREEAG
jgi:hypothetical protein